MSDRQNLLNDLARAKAVFQVRAVKAAMGITENDCPVCGEDHEGNVPLACETGDGGMITKQELEQPEETMATNHKHYEAARRAYYWTSFDPEKRANGECAFFDEICAEFCDSPQVVEKFERLFLLSLSAKSRCMSSMITGPARFPVAKAERANAREHKISSEMLDYVDRVRKAKKQEAYYAAHPEARPVMSGDSDAVERLREKLAKLQKAQETMVAANKIIRKLPVDRNALVALLGSETAADSILKPDCFGGVGFASFSLSNNRASMKQVEERIAEIEKRKATAAKDVVINGVRVLENSEAMRLQLFFEGKPAAAMIALLKRHAFKWSPSNMAWQRQLTNNAIYSFNHFVLPELKKLATNSVAA